MKIKKKRCTECGQLFTPRRTTDRFCSPACFFSFNKKRGKKKAAAPRKRIKAVSDKLAKRKELYQRRRKDFLNRPENEFCPVAEEIFNKRIRATEIHHKAGRTGDLLLYEPFWLAVSREGHSWIDNNPEKAYQLGFLLHSSRVKINEKK